MEPAARDTDRHRPAEPASEPLDLVGTRDEHGRPWIRPRARRTPGGTTTRTQAGVERDDRRSDLLASLRADLEPSAPAPDEACAEAPREPPRVAPADIVRSGSTDAAPSTEAVRAGAEPPADATDARHGLPTGTEAKPAASDATRSSPAVAQEAADLLDDRFDEDLVHRISPLFKLLRLYSRLEVTGLEHVTEGPAILVANHTGWLGLDYAYTALSVYDARKRLVRGMAHHAWFAKQQVGRFAQRLGMYEVSKQTMRALLDRGDLVLIFPEGEKGAFKGEHQRYQLQDFARGYLRVALEAGVPIVPVGIVGGEEANPSSHRIDSYDALLNLSLPTPQNLFPRPVKWRITFLPPVQLERGPEAAADKEYVHTENERIRGRLQMEIARLISVRGHPFL